MTTIVEPTARLRPFWPTHRRASARTLARRPLQSSATARPSTLSFPISAPFQLFPLLFPVSVSCRYLSCGTVHANTSQVSPVFDSRISSQDPRTHSSAHLSTLDDYYIRLPGYFRVVRRYTALLYPTSLSPLSSSLLLIPSAPLVSARPDSRTLDRLHTPALLPVYQRETAFEPERSDKNSDTVPHEDIRY